MNVYNNRRLRGSNCRLACTLHTWLHTANTVTVTMIVNGNSNTVQVVTRQSLLVQLERVGRSTNASD